MLELSEIQGPGILVINDSFYPGWRAFNFDGKTMQILPTNVAMRAVVLPENKPYQMTLRFEPWWLKWAQIMTFIGLLILLVMMGRIVLLWKMK
jgi:uncharacterized membrane protein YfhO